MKVLYLYEEVMGYTAATISALVARGVEVHVVHWDHKKLTPYEMRDLPGVFTYPRSQLTKVEMIALGDRLDPALTVVSGWNDRGYLAVASRLRTKGSKVIAALDGQWRGSARQRLAALLGSGGYFSQYFSHAWVAGACQFEYARRLGFEKGVIVQDLYSADVHLFEAAYRERMAQKEAAYPHRFLFAGRLEPVKGLDTLLDAWQLLGAARRDWELCAIGNGSLQTSLASASGVLVKGFMQPEALVAEIAAAGCFILPSRSEPWGVVIHECAAAGLPLIVSEAVGAARTFVIAGFNGLTFPVGDHHALAKRMRQIIQSADLDLLTMSRGSNQLSRRITPQTSAANLLALAS